MVYAKPPFGGPAHVLKYLSRYTHRVAAGWRKNPLTFGKRKIDICKGCFY